MRARRTVDIPRLPSHRRRRERDSRCLPAAPASGTSPQAEPARADHCALRGLFQPGYHRACAVALLAGRLGENTQMTWAQPPPNGNAQEKGGEDEQGDHDFLRGPHFGHRLRGCLPQISKLV